MDVLKLKFTLDMKYANEEEIQTLKKYGAMENEISREVLVPSDITLHALHYAIQRMFGWQNSHLHNFCLPKEVFDKLTENQFRTWAQMAGAYFRFPTEDYEDIYWDDDYREGQNIKSWMKKKYTGPYRYKGFGEHYLRNQMKVSNMFLRCEEITVREFNFGAKKQPEPYQVKLKDATIDQVMVAVMDMVCYELIERLPLASILSVKGKEKVSFAKAREHLERQMPEDEMKKCLMKYINTTFRSEKAEQDFLGEHNISTLPIADQLIYSYDFGDGWEVMIQCENIYHQDENGVWKDIDEGVPEVSMDDLAEVMEKYRPVCIAKDGIELVDDVGGVSGFCGMLEMIYGSDMEEEEDLEERDHILEWADMMGWRGKEISPKRTL